MSYFNTHYRERQYRSILQVLQEDFNGRAPSRDMLIKGVIKRFPWKYTTTRRRLVDLRTQGYVVFEAGEAHTHIVVFKKKRR